MPTPHPTAEPRCTKPCDFAACVINAPTLEEGGSTVYFEEIAFGYIDGFKGRRIKGDIKLPARQVGNIFCADVEGKGIARMNSSLGKSVADTGGCYCIFRARFKPKLAVMNATFYPNRD